MEGLYNWIRNLTCYLIFVTVVINLLPHKKYEKYLRFFFGMVFLLLVIQPFTRSLRIEEKIAYYFGTLSLQNDAADLKRELLGAETVRLEQMLGRYEEAVGEDIRQLTETGGFLVNRVSVTLGKEPDRQDFGRVTGISLTVIPEDASGSTGLPMAAVPDPVTPVLPVVPVEIGESEIQEEKSNQRESEDAAVGALRKQLLNYYDLEEADVEIQVQNRQRQVDATTDSGVDPDDPGIPD